MFSQALAVIQERVSESGEAAGEPGEAAGEPREAAGEPGSDISNTLEISERLFERVLSPLVCRGKAP
eukprot:5931282-Pleurochrysis_carterae.AAC.1